MALEPAGLEGDGTAADGPFGAVLRGGHAAAWGKMTLVCSRVESDLEVASHTWIDPLHAIRVRVGIVLGVVGDTQTVSGLDGAVGMQVIPPIARIDDDTVGVCPSQTQQEGSHPLRHGEGTHGGRKEERDGTANRAKSRKIAPVKSLRSTRHSTD